MYEHHRSARTSTDLIAPARIPAFSKFLGTGIAMVAFTFAATSFGLSGAPSSDAPPVPANPGSPHAMIVDDVDHLLEVDSPQFSPDGKFN